MWLIFIGAAAAATALIAGRKKPTDEPEIEDIDNLEVTLGYGWEDVSALVDESIGWPYWWGKGSPSTPWTDGAGGVDCNGYAQMFLVELGVLDQAAPDRGVSAMANVCDPVAVGDQQPGDLVLYNGAGHVMVVAGPPGADGHSPVCGASSGGSDDFGDNPNARVKLFTTALYWSKFNTYMRLKPEYRVS